MTPRQIAAAVALADTLARENAALAALDLAGAAAMLDAKQAAAAAFAAAQATPAAPDAAHQRLAAQLRDLADENRRLLERAIRVQGRVLEVVARALPKPPGRRYGATGAPARGAVAPVIVSARV
ncbi:MAG: hypothetical protein M0Z28_32510 [Rhodospirillales bacterium]|nr:hypothetical protein [Rhodospirillales bacterium]